MSGTLAEKLWESHVVHRAAGEPDVLYVDLHLVHEVTRPQAVDGRLPTGVTSKDVILALIARIGTGGGQGHMVEYRGDAVEAMSMEARMTMCNMTIEAGARAGMVAPDETTYAYLKDRPHVPAG